MGGRNGRIQGISYKPTSVVRWKARISILCRLYFHTHVVAHTQIHKRSLFLSLLFETEPHYTVQVSLELDMKHGLQRLKLSVLPSHLFQCWDYRCVISSPGPYTHGIYHTMQRTEPCASYMLGKHAINWAFISQFPFLCVCLFVFSYNNTRNKRF